MGTKKDLLRLLMLVVVEAIFDTKDRLSRSVLHITLVQYSKESLGWGVLMLRLL